MNQFFCILHFCHTCSLCRVELVVHFPARGSNQVLLCLTPGVLWLWHFLYSVGPHTVSNLNIYTFVVSRAFIAVLSSQVGDADSSRAPGLTSGLQGSVNVHHVALLLMPQLQCISSFCILHLKDASSLNCPELLFVGIYINLNNALICWHVNGISKKKIYQKKKRNIINSMFHNLSRYAYHSVLQTLSYN